MSETLPIVLAEYRHRRQNGNEEMTVLKNFTEEVRHDPSDRFASVSISAIVEEGIGPYVRFGDFTFNAAYARSIASKLLQCADVVDPRHREHVLGEQDYALLDEERL